jgi:hypothetical protein
MNLELLPYFSSYAYLDYFQRTGDMIILEDFIEGQEIFLIYQDNKTKKNICIIKEVQENSSGTIYINIPEAQDHRYLIAIPHKIVIYIPSITFINQEAILLKKKRITQIGILYKFPHTYTNLVPDTLPSIYNKMVISNQEISMSKTLDATLATVNITGAFEEKEYPFTILYAGGDHLQIYMGYRDLEITLQQSNK